MKRKNQRIYICLILSLIMMTAFRSSTKVSALSATVLLSPYDGEFISDDTPFLEWITVTDAVKYQVQVDDLSFFISPFLYANTTDTNYTIFFTLDDDTYYWRVRALSASEEWGPFSEIWEFSIDTVKPYINRPPNIEYEEGETGNEIDWIPIDDFPGDYVVYFDDTEIQSGQWNSTEWITINVDGLSVGVYNYTIWIDDHAGKTNKDTVWVTVTPTTIPEITEKQLLILLPIFTSVCIIVRKKKTREKAMRQKN